MCVCVCWSSAWCITLYKIYNHHNDVSHVANKAAADNMTNAKKNECRIYNVVSND